MSIGTCPECGHVIDSLRTLGPLPWWEHIGYGYCPIDASALKDFCQMETPRIVKEPYR